jgi:cell wall-associated NlpC family hydrolase
MKQAKWMKMKWLLSLSMFITLLFVGSAETWASQVSRADRIIDDGEKYYGTPYRFGSKTYTTRSFDCSSFTKRIFKENGIYLPRDSRQQSKAGVRVSLKNARKGDLLFFDTNRDRRIDHVAVYAGKGKLLHTYKRPIGVTYSRITRDNYWGKTLVTARRVI